MIRSIIVGGMVAASIAAGALSAFFVDTSPNVSVGRGIHRAINDQQAARQDGTFVYNDWMNLDWPMLSEDRYVDGEWTGPVTPFELPHASGQCDPCN